MGVLKTVTDTDGVGLDHSASFSFDGAERLVAAQLGSAANAFSFSYGYDDLQNMISRLSSGRAASSILAGTYHYGESGAGPRQLTRVVAANQSVTTFGYDGAGRQTKDGDLQLSYDSFERLTGATRAGQAVASYSYGYEGQRIVSKEGDGSTQLWYTEDIAERHGVREHYVRIAGRTLARVDSALGSAATVVATGLPAPAGSAALLIVFGLLLCVAFLAEPRRRGQRFATMFALWAMVPGCWGQQNAARTTSALASANILYFHQGVSAGPVMFTRADGSLAEERRFEPYGGPLEAARPSVASTAVDFSLEPTNALDKETDPSTGFSYHGARWLDPRIARWTEPDPPTKGPDKKFMLSPWKLHPYEYVDQNPISFWDPDGREPNACVDPSASVNFTPNPNASSASEPTPPPSTVTAATSTTAPQQPSVPQVTPEAWHPPMAPPADAPAVPPPAPPTNGVFEATKSAGWDLVSATPGGAKANLALDVISTGVSALSGDTEGTENGAGSVAVDGMCFIPVAGQILTVESFVWDGAMSVARDNNVPEEKAPTFSEAFTGGVKGIINDFTSAWDHPESWVP
jgi:RHS repeat-associated protein